MSTQGATPASKTTPPFAEILCREARKTLDAAEKDLGSSSAAGAFARGQVFELVGYLEAAAAAYGEALSCDATLSKAKARQALAFLKAGQIERGLELATTLAATGGKLQLQTLATAETFSVMTVLGDALIASGRLNDAVEAYKIARTINPNDNYATAQLAEIYLATNEPKPAADLGPSIDASSRFEPLKTVLGLGGTSLALLPAHTPAALVANVRHQLPGRPMDVHGEPRFAPIEEGRSEWCADLSDLLEE